MESLQYVKAEDRAELPATRRECAALSPDRLFGVWMNTNGAGRGIAKIVVTPRGADLIVRVFGADDSGLCDWGEVRADCLYANSISSDVAGGFTARYESDFSQTDLQANWNQGLLVVAAFTTFTDGSRRSDYFSREFFHQGLNGSPENAKGGS